MSIEKFKEIPNTVRDTMETYRARKESPIIKALLEDKTIFINAEDVANENQLNKFYETARPLGFKLNKRKTKVEGKEGFVLWFTKKEESVEAK